MIKFKCASCGEVYELPDAAAGKKAKCKACGAVMKIPAAAAVNDDPLGLGGAQSSSGNDLSSLYGSTPEPTSAAPPAFNPAASFTNAPRRSSGPPMKLIIGLAGGAVGLIVIVILAVALMGGGGDDDKNKDDGPGGLAITGGSVPSGGADSAPDLDASDDNDDTQPVYPKHPDVLGASAVDIPSADDMMDWSMQADDQVAALDNRVAYRGLVFHLPSSWSAEEIKFSECLGFGVSGQDDIVASFCDDSGAVGVLQCKPSSDVELNVLVSRRKNTWDWPLAYKADQLKTEMFVGPTFIDQMTQLGESGGEAQRHLGDFMIGVVEELVEGSLIAFQVVEPQRFFLSELRSDRIEFGALFGGHRFIRVEGHDATGRKHLGYVGYVGDMQVVMLAEVAHDKINILSLLDRIIRSGSLMDRSEMRSFASSDPIYSSWLDDSQMTLVASSESAPLAGLTKAIWDVSDHATSDLDLYDERLSAPTNKPFGLVVPESMQVISTTRTAVRTRPMDDGTWLTLEVHKLAGLDRRAVDLVDQADGTVLMRGQRVALHEAAEVSELASEAFTIQRLLKPALPGLDVREVVYVMKEGAYLITVIGRYPADSDEWLETFDAAAMSVQKMPEADDADDDFKFEFELKDDDESGDESDSE